MGSNVHSSGSTAAEVSRLPSQAATHDSQKARTLVVHTVGWLGLYVLICVSPLMLLSLRAPATRGFWFEFGVGLGMVGFAMLALQSLSIARFRHVASFFGSDAILLYHRQLGIIALLFVLAHPLILFAVQPQYLEYLDPRVNALRAIFLTAATIGLVLLVALPFLRESVHLKYEWWRLSHAVCAGGVVLVGLVHGLQVGHYISGFWKPLLWVAFLLIGLTPIAYVRLVRPWLARRTPYRVEQVREEHGDTTTLVLRPDGHDGFRFRPGQFAWFTLGDSPFRLQQHPFSLAGSASVAGEYKLSVKALGDFTSAVSRVPAGSRAFLDGPYGAFSLDAQPWEGAVLIMGGIGITPAISMLRTCRDRGERRPMILIYGNSNWEEVAFREELGMLTSELNLQVIHVLESPPKDWQGETGRIRDEVLKRHLPKDGRDYHYFVCGPAPMMDVAEKYLVAEGIPVWKRSVERFDFV